MGKYKESKVYAHRNFIVVGDHGAIHTICFLGLVPIPLSAGLLRQMLVDTFSAALTSRIRMTSQTRRNLNRLTALSGS